MASVISVAIMHHASRQIPLVLTERVPGAVIVDGPTLWETAKMAWRAGNTSHQLVMHDDMRPCVDFLTHAQRIVDLLPDVPISFWRQREETNTPGGFVAYNTFSWGGALCLPRDLIPQFLDWSACIEPTWKADDTRLTLWCCTTGRKIYYPCPSIVQHEGLHSAAWPGVTRPDLVAHDFDEDPTGIVWRNDVKEYLGDARLFVVSRKSHYLKGYNVKAQ